MIFHEYFRSWGGEKFPIWLIYYWQNTYIFTYKECSIQDSRFNQFENICVEWDSDMRGQNLNQAAPQEDKCEPL